MVREIIKDFLESEGAFKVIGEAENGQEGLEKMLALNPDLVTMDIEMPVMNGLEAIEAAMKQIAVPIVVVTDFDTAEVAYQASMKGALEFYAKTLFTSPVAPGKQREIYETLKRISGVKARKPADGFLKKAGEVSEASGFLDVSGFSEKFKTASGFKTAGEFKSASGFKFTSGFKTTGDFKSAGGRKVGAVVVAASTGGPKALSRFFSFFPADFPAPILTVQHNTSGFDAGFASWLDGCTRLQVKLADEGEIPRAGAVYIARTDRHLEARLGRAGLYLAYTDGKPEHNQKPAADALFRSAAEALRAEAVSVVLTGMGEDGAAGTRKVREMGGITLAQDEETSLIYGMPKAAAETGCIDMVLPLDRLAEAVIALTLNPLVLNLPAGAGERSRQ
jgi:two-component system chemotaxis response regulator CheB